MRRLALSAAAVAMFSTAAFSMSVPRQANLAAPRSASVENARIVCEESGQCYRLRGQLSRRDGFMATVHFMVRMTGRVITVAQDSVTAGLFWACGSNANLNSLFSLLSRTRRDGGACVNCGPGPG
jgi:hypothetical protein